MDQVSPLEQARAQYAPKLPPVFAENGPCVKAVEGDPTEPVGDKERLQQRFPKTCGEPVVTFSAEAGDAPAHPVKVGVVLSGGQAPGGHNVICGLYDAVKAMHQDSELYGFLGGPQGLIDNDFKLLTGDVIDAYRNTGGFDMIQSGRTKLEKEEQFKEVAANCEKLGIHGIVIIGGDDSNTNACMLAEYFLQNNIDIKVIGCPKTIDGDLKNQQIEASFGFDTATKVYSELIGNIQRDTNSARKYWHFIRVMGRSASHIALECALQTRPNATIISEEVEQKQQTLQDIVNELAAIIAKRAEQGKQFGVAIIPEGLIEFVPQVKKLIGELNELLAANDEHFQSLPTTDDKLQFINSRLSSDSSKAFSSLPADIQEQLIFDRDPHGNVQVSRIETEKLLSDMVQDVLREWKDQGKFKGKFSAHHHFFGYEGRCAQPSNFDADYCYSLGYTAAALVQSGKTGYISSVRNLAKPAGEWEAGGIPLTMMMNMERRRGEDTPVIRRALVELDDKPFQTLQQNRQHWAENEAYLYPGPIQYFGPAEVCDRCSETLRLEHR